MRRLEHRTINGYALPELTDKILDVIARGDFRAMPHYAQAMAIELIQARAELAECRALIDEAVRAIEAGAPPCE
jgi:hypothetical protein